MLRASAVKRFTAALAFRYALVLGGQHIRASTLASQLTNIILGAPADNPVE